MFGAWKTFVNMFYALDLAYDDNPSRTLGQFLSDMNPFLFRGAGSADPAIYAEFKHLFAMKFDNKNPDSKETYGFVVAYLEKKNPLFSSLFQANTDEDTWRDTYSEID